MKKTITQISNEVVEDAKIFKDMEFYSGGKIKMSTDKHILHEFKAQPKQQNKKKKR